MKRLLPLLIFLLICSFAQTSSARMCTAIAGGSAASAAGCSTSTDYVGDKTEYTESNAIPTVDTLFCIAYQAVTASCSSGTLGKAYISHHGTATDNIKICVYENGSGRDAVPVNGDDLIGSCSDVITCSENNGVASCTDGSDLGGTITKDSWYYVCTISDSTAFEYHRATTGQNLYYKQYANSYTSPPSALTSTNWNIIADREIGAYVEIK